VPESPADPPPSLPIFGGAPRERADAARNRLAVLAAAERLFALHGVQHVSMDAIAAEAGVGKGTLFRRFGDRAGLARALLDRDDRALQEAAIRGPAPLGPGASPRARLKAFGAASFALLETHAELMTDAEGVGWLKSDASAFRRLHVLVLIAEADPAADAEMLADVLLVPLAPFLFRFWREVAGMSLARVTAGFEDLVDRVLPP